MEGEKFNQQTVNTIDFGKTRHQLRLQNEIREGKARIAGGLPKSFDDVVNRADSVLESILETNDGKKNFDRIYELTQQLGLPEKEMEDNYLDGLKFNLKAAQRLGFFKTDSNTDLLIENLISSYTLNFRQTLRNFVKPQPDEYTKPILYIAKRSYIISPDIYQKLTKKYKSDIFIDELIIKNFIIHNISDPESAILKAKDQFVDLQSRYQGDDFVDLSVIRNFILHNPDNPGLFIENAKKRFYELKSEFKDDGFVENWILKSLSISNPDDSRTAYLNAKKHFFDIKLIYINDNFVTDRLIKNFVIRNFSNPEKAIAKACEQFKKLKLKYKNDNSISDSFLKEMVISNPSDPEKAISRNKNN